MPHEIKIVSVSLPASLVHELDKVCEVEQKNRSELYREALRQFLKNRRWLQLREYSEAKGLAGGVTKVEIEAMLDELSR